MAFTEKRHNATWVAVVLLGTLACGTIAEAKPVCSHGSKSSSIWLKLRPGYHQVTVHGELTPKHSSYSYSFKARAGEKLTWNFNGPMVRTMIRYPTGETDGPGLPNDIALTRTGAYTFTVSSNTMAEGIYGPFELTLQLQKSQ